MATEPDLDKIAAQAALKNRYRRQLDRVSAATKQTDCIEDAVEGAMRNLPTAPSGSLVIYGEPQSGKTEMMICLTARLLDEGHRTIVHLMNDSKDLLVQNLDRFRLAGLAPSPRVSQELPRYPLVTGNDAVVFCKKNSKDLVKLITALEHVRPVVVIDDEADYATPNAKINVQLKTKINELITTLLGKDGKYIGVTATPARLHLNNTFNNRTETWVPFRPHAAYTGQEDFFPVKEKPKFRLTLLPGSGTPEDARRALARFAIDPGTLAIHTSQSIEGYSNEQDKATISRRQGFMGTNQLEPARFPKAVHHIKIFHNGRGKARVPPQSIDLVLTSPPYLNAIDYMRCSKFTLVWMGYSIDRLRSIRGESIGCESSLAAADESQWVRDVARGLRLRPALSSRHHALLCHYIWDMGTALGEAARVLAPGGRAVYVVGDSTIRGTFVRNSGVVAAVGQLHGLRVRFRASRALPANHRYLPPPRRTGTPGRLDDRMRRETVLEFQKDA